MCLLSSIGTLKISTKLNYRKSPELENNKPILWNMKREREREDEEELSN